MLSLLRDWDRLLASTFGVASAVAVVAAAESSVPSCTLVSVAFLECDLTAAAAAATGAAAAAGAAFISQYIH
jgi:hypothetical protein